jgi:regulatory protein
VADHNGKHETGRGRRRPGGGARPDRGHADVEDTADPEARARQICLRLLTLAPRTRAQLAEALSKRGIPAEAADAVLDRFTGVGLIDDAAFARAWVESRHYSRGLAGRALRAELRQRGVDDGQIRDAIDDLGPDAEVATARRLVQQKLASTRGLAPEARIRRLAGTLARKGYPAGLAFRVIREAMEAEGAGGALEGDWEEGEELYSHDPDALTE